MSASPAIDTRGFVAGTVIARRYRLDRLLGEGGMGVVWAATHTVTGRAVAMKFLRGEPARISQELRRRFLREARSATAVKHPNVVTISDVFELDDDTPVMVMDLLIGETLGQRLAQVSKLSVEQTAAILIQVISAVGAAHALGIVHRDLKPDNIFILEGTSPENAVRVLDFGIAKVLEPDADSDSASLITKTGTILGTPCYMSPEQALGEPDIDHRSDIWALGVILYECLAGVRPIQGDSMGQIVKQILLDGVRPIEELEPDLPPAVSQLVGRMLSRERSKRPSDLNRVLGPLAQYTQVLVPPFGPPEQDGEWSLENYAELETVRADQSDGPPDRAAPAPRMETEGAQSVSNGVQHHGLGWKKPLTVGAAAIVVGIAAWQGQKVRGRSQEGNALDVSSSRANTASSPAPFDHNASSLAPRLAAAAPVLSTPASPDHRAPSNKAGQPAVPAAAKGLLAGPHSALSSVASSAPSGGMVPATPSAAPSQRTSRAGLSETVPF